MQRVPETSTVTLANSDPFVPLAEIIAAVNYRILGVKFVTHLDTSNYTLVGQLDECTRLFTSFGPNEQCLVGFRAETKQGRIFFPDFTQAWIENDNIKDVADRYESALKTIITSFGDGEELNVGFGSSPLSILTADLGVAKLLDLKPFIVKGAMPVLDTTKNETFARIPDHVKNPLASKLVTIFGCGSVGAMLAELLVRSGLRNFQLVDIEAVDQANLARTVYDARDIGKPKVEALKAHLLAINPALNIMTSQEDIMSPEIVSDWIKTFNFGDILVAATDAVNVQIRLSQIGRGKGIYTFIPGLHLAAVTGEIVLLHPEGPCYQCITDRGVVSPVGTVGNMEVDYGTGRVHGVLALTSDIVNVVNLTAKIILGVLCYLASPEGTEPIEILGRDVIGNQFALVCTSHYMKDYLLSLRDRKYETLPPGTYGQGIFWHGAGQYERKPTCDCCGEHPVPLERRSWMSAELVNDFLTAARNDAVEFDFDMTDCPCKPIPIKDGGFH